MECCHGICSTSEQVNFSEIPSVFRGYIYQKVLCVGWILRDGYMQLSVLLLGGIGFTWSISVCGSFLFKNGIIYLGCVPQGRLSFIGISSLLVLYIYVTLWVSTFIPSQKVFWRSFTPSTFRTRAKAFRNVLRTYLEQEPKGFGANRLWTREFLFRLFHPSNEFHDSSNEIARLKRIFPFKISSENDKTK